ncbi:MAG: PilZ domain-containing protein [Myxococcota bacterium]
MQTWNGSQLAPQRHEPILVIGDDAPFRRALVKEVEALPAPTLVANSLAEAVDRADDFDRAPSIVLVPEACIDGEFETALAELRIRANAADLVPIAFGRAPDDERRREIRNAGVELALFGRFGRHALRFQINRALSSWCERPPRGEQRAPMEWRTRTYSSGKEKSVRCYSLSSGGAYFVTPRPWVVGSEIALELPVGRDRLLVSGKILYTNMGDDRNGLPRGMAVAFRPLSEHIQQVIREDVTTTHEALEV